MPAGWDPVAGDFPVAPRNVNVLSAYLRGIVDIRWDNPAQHPGNSSFSVLGVNIYRSYGDRSMPVKLNPYPVGGNVWRDFTDNVPVTEIVDWDTGWANRGDGVAQRSGAAEDINNPNVDLVGTREPRWTLRTQFPIHKQIGGYSFDGQAAFGDAPKDVAVFVNSAQAVVHSVLGHEREVTLLNISGFDPNTEQEVPAVLPTSDADEVLVCYFTNKNLLRTDLDIKPVYRVTTVAADPNTPSGLIETPLNFAEPIALRDVEKLTWKWREAIARNNWILQQGGERVLLFTKKAVGAGCPSCYQDPQRRAQYRQPRNLCQICFGTGIMGGYDGPFEVIVSPDEAERKVSQRANGRTLEHTYEVWTGPTPMLTHRDFIVKQTGERYAVGGIRNIASRGRVLQQHFTISYLDESNIVYFVPVDGTIGLPYPQTRGAVPIIQGGAWPPAPPPGPYPVGPDQVHPTVTEKENIPDDREQRGRTRVHENITY